MARYVLDAIGEICPVPLLLVRRKMAELIPGDELVVITDFDRAVRNILDWADKEGHDILIVGEAEPGLWNVTLRKIG